MDLVNIPSIVEEGVVLALQGNIEMGHAVTSLTVSLQVVLFRPKVLSSRAHRWL